MQSQKSAAKLQNNQPQGKKKLKHYRKQLEEAYDTQHDELRDFVVGEDHVTIVDTLMAAMSKMQLAMEHLPPTVRDILQVNGSAITDTIKRVVNFMLSQREWFNITDSIKEQWDKELDRRDLTDQIAALTKQLAQCEAKNAA